MEVNKPLISYWTYIGFIVVSTLAMLFIVGYVVDNIEAIKQSPFAYGIAKLGGNIQCTCIQNHGLNNVERPTIMFFIDDSGVYQHDSNRTLRKVLPIELKINKPE